MLSVWRCRETLTAARLDSHTHQAPARAQRAHRQRGFDALAVGQDELECARAERLGPVASHTSTTSRRAAAPSRRNELVEAVPHDRVARHAKRCPRVAWFPRCAGCPGCLVPTVRRVRPVRAARAAWPACWVQRARRVRAARPARAAWRAIPGGSPGAGDLADDAGGSRDESGVLGERSRGGPADLGDRAGRRSAGGQGARCRRHGPRWPRRYGDAARSCGAGHCRPGSRDPPRRRPAGGRDASSGRGVGDDPGARDRRGGAAPSRRGQGAVGRARSRAPRSRHRAERCRRGVRLASHLAARGDGVDQGRAARPPGRPAPRSPGRRRADDGSSRSRVRSSARLARRKDAVVSAREPGERRAARRRGLAAALAADGHAGQHPQRSRAQAARRIRRAPAAGDPRRGFRRRHAGVAPDRRNTVDWTE